jgi:hypothetical protein
MDRIIADIGSRKVGYVLADLSSQLEVLRLAERVK